jgi:uncharacterized protein with ParB-like and HNH nuclease domain
MSFQTPITIAAALDNIERQFYLLPAIQRDFEWWTDRIERLFDSLMREYPVSSFLFWDVQDRAQAGYRFYRFLRIYRQGFKTQSEEAGVGGPPNFHAVLDGQQRLTSLYIGLMGSFAYREPRRWLIDTETNIPTRHLYLNISRTLANEEDGREYRFSFLKDKDTSNVDLHVDPDGTWFRVGKIMALADFYEYTKFITTNEIPEIGQRILARLLKMVFQDRVINFYLERDQDLQKALNIFIRINSGAIQLDFSDLVMSIAVANWQKKNAREEFHSLVTHIQRVEGFVIQKSFILKTYLYLYSKDIRFRVTNFSAQNAQDFEANWENIRDAIQEAFALVRSFGYTDYTLAAKNAVLPIIYYLYHRSIYAHFTTAIAYQEDRRLIRKWLHEVILKQVFGGQADAILSQIRRAFVVDVTAKPKIAPEITQFPVAGINEQIKVDMSVGEEFIARLLEIRKDDRYAFCVLALLYPHLDYRNNDFHMDHLHPWSGFNAKAIDALALAEVDKVPFVTPEWYDSIVNLQMLDANENMSKQDKSLQEWIDFESQHKNRDLLLQRCLIPPSASLAFKDFGKFAEQRKALLADKLRQLLG